MEKKKRTKDSPRYLGYQSAEFFLPEITNSTQSTNL